MALGSNLLRSIGAILKMKYTKDTVYFLVLFVVAGLFGRSCEPLTDSSTTSEVQNEVSSAQADFAELPEGGFAVQTGTSTSPAVEADVPALSPKDSTRLLRQMPIEVLRAMPSIYGSLAEVSTKRGQLVVAWNEEARIANERLHFTVTFDKIHRRQVLADGTTRIWFTMKAREHRNGFSFTDLVCLSYPDEMYPTMTRGFYRVVERRSSSAAKVSLKEIGPKTYAFIVEHDTRYFHGPMDRRFPALPTIAKSARSLSVIAMKDDDLEPIATFTKELINPIFDSTLKIEVSLRVGTNITNGLYDLVAVRKQVGGRGNRDSKNVTRISCTATYDEETASYAVPDEVGPVRLMGHKFIAYDMEYRRLMRVGD